MDIMVSITRLERGSMEELIRQFIEHLEKDERKSANTCQSYYRDLRQMADWISSSFGVDDAAVYSGSNLKEYYDFLVNAGKSPATISRFVASAKAFFEYLIRQGLILHDPCTALKAPKVIRKKPSILTEAETVKLLSAPDEDNKGVRDRAMLELMCDTGLRVSELLGITLSDIDVQKRQITVPGSRTRKIQYDKKVNRYLEEYLETSRNALLGDQKDEGYLFLNVSGESMSRQGFWKLIKKYGKEAGIGMELTPHVLRHSFAAHALRSGKDIKKVQSILGHSDLSTTSGYLNM